ncbi:MAG TPA: BON domain-containing protein [Kofleriaceae bacterium]|jgi:osmotically-inducible protein OsmY|nr:BON domain-containing protein [Kofleriaceae bacterium]
MRKSLFVALLATAALSACKASSNQPPAADNTAQNDRAHATAPNADHASNKKSDLDVTQQLRKAVMADDSLSTNAHNCKIVVQDGSITLAGPVASDAERTKLAALAAQVAGDHKIDNQLQVTN